MSLFCFDFGSFCFDWNWIVILILKLDWLNFMRYWCLACLWCDTFMYFWFCLFVCWLVCFDLVSLFVLIWVGLCFAILLWVFIELFLVGCLLCLCHCVDWLVFVILVLVDSWELLVCGGFWLCSWFCSLGFYFVFVWVLILIFTYWFGIVLIYVFYGVVCLVFVCLWIFVLCFTFGLLVWVHWFSPERSRLLI